MAVLALVVCAVWARRVKGHDAFAPFLELDVASRSQLASALDAGSSP